MSDLISRQAAIDALYDWSNHSMTNAEAWHLRQVIGDIKSMPSARPDNKVNLCDSCRYSYPVCPSKAEDVIWGNGTGNDNICACSKYEPSAQPEKGKCKKCRYVYYDKEFGNYWCTRKPDSFMVEEDGYCKWGK